MALTAPEREPREVTGSYAASVDAAFDALSAAAPEGWRVELIEGEIHVVPPANGEHEEIVSEVTEQLVQRRESKKLRDYTGIGLKIPGASLTGRVVPDLVIAPKGSFADDLEYHSPDAVVLVAEVTSRSTAADDRGGKLIGYARAGIPCYLLVDREAGWVVLHSEPEPAKERYTRRAEVEFSKTIHLPEPLGFDLDTSEF